MKNSKYNLRQDECKAAAYALMGYADLDYGTFAEARLRDVPYEVFEDYKERLPELWCRRAEPFYSEFARAEKGAELWRKGDLEGYGQLVFESGRCRSKSNWRILEGISGTGREVFVLCVRKRRRSESVGEIL